MVQSRPLFRLFSSFPLDTTINLEKLIWFAWDSNPGRQDGRRRWIHVLWRHPQMVRFCFNIWLFPKWKLAQKLQQICPTFYRIIDKPSKICQICKILPKWRNFAKYGHTGCNQEHSLVSGSIIVQVVPSWTGLD